MSVVNFKCEACKSDKEKCPMLIETEFMIDKSMLLCHGCYSKLNYETEIVTKTCFNCKKKSNITTSDDKGNRFCNDCICFCCKKPLNDSEIYAEKEDSINISLKSVIDENKLVEKLCKSCYETKGFKDYDFKVNGLTGKKRKFGDVSTTFFDENNNPNEILSIDSDDDEGGESLEHKAKIQKIN